MAQSRIAKDARLERMRGEPFGVSSGARSAPKQGQASSAVEIYWEKHKFRRLPAPLVNSLSGSSMRVLLVDDSPDVANMLKSLLEHAGHQVRCAFAGHEAISAATAFSPDAYAWIWPPGHGRLSIGDQAS